MSHTSEGLNGGFTFFFILGSFITSFIFPAELSVLLLILSYTTAIYTVALMTGNQNDSYGDALYFYLILIIATVAIFASIYWQYGLISNGEKVDITIMKSIYFSITTWTTLGYGDFSPTPRIRHITSIQAILGYVGLGLWVSLITSFMNQLQRKTRQIRKHNERIINREKIENSKEEIIKSLENLRHDQLDFIYKMVKSEEEINNEKD